MENRSEHQEELEILAQHLKDKGIDFHRLPEDVYPGMSFTTVTRLFQSGLTRYSLPHIYRLSRDPSISTLVLGEERVFDVLGVQQILNREQESLAGRLPRRVGAKPGKRIRNISVNNSQNP